MFGLDGDFSPVADQQLLFDKLRYMDRLTRAGVSEETARAHAEAMEEALRESVATKGDITGLRTELLSDIAAVRTELLQLKHDLTVRMGVISAAVVAILASIKYFG